MKVIVERIEGNFLICETEKGSYVELPLELVPDAYEGAVLKIEFDKEDEKAKRQRIERMMKELF